MSWLGLLLAISALAVPQDEYRLRRAKLRQALPDSAIVLASAEDTSSDPRSALLQEPNFYYLTGWNEPGAVLLILPEAAEPNEILFLPPHNSTREKFEGRRLAASDPGADKSTGVQAVMSTDLWEAEVKRRTEGLKSVFALKGKKSNDAITRVFEGREVRDASIPIARLRMVKSPTEIEMLQRSINVSIDAHLTSWKKARPGQYEFQVAAAMTQVILDSGCERHAYRPVVGSGPNSVVLHYGVNHRRFDKGEVLLMDVGAECSAYASDITRTIPIGGKFNARQREIYELVLGAQKAAIAAVRPGASLGSAGELLQAAKQYLDTHGAPVNGQPLSSYMIHGIGHHVGLEVHDPADPDLTLKPGMVFTIEPGIYIADEKIGVRIEDVILITETGAEVLSSSLPRDPQDVEKALRKK